MDSALGEKLLGEGDPAVGKNLLGEGDSADGKKSPGEGDSAVGKNSLGGVVSAVEGEDSTVCFYNRCEIACCAAGVDSTPLEVSTKFMRFLKSAVFGCDPGEEHNFSAVRIQKLQMGMLKDPSLSLFSQDDSLLIGDICNSASCLLNTPDFDERTLQAIDHLKGSQEDIDAYDPLPTEDDIGGEILPMSKYNRLDAESSYHPSDSNDADSDLDRKPACHHQNAVSVGLDGCLAFSVILLSRLALRRQYSYIITKMRKRFLFIITKTWVMYRSHPFFWWCVAWISTTSPVVVGDVPP